MYVLNNKTHWQDMMLYNGWKIILIKCKLYQKYYLHNLGIKLLGILID